MVDVADIGLLDGRGRHAVQRVVSATARRCARAVAPDADARRDRREPQPGPHLELGARQRRLHRAGGGEARSSTTRTTRASRCSPVQAADALTTTQQRGIKTIQASAYGNTITYTPEDRAARALDGDLKTAWRAAALGDAVGQFIRLQLAAPITHRSRQPRAAAQRQPQPVDHPGRAALRRQGRSSTVTLDASSRTAAGQTISFGRAPLLDARDPDHRRERSAAQAVQRRRRRRASPRSGCATSTPTTTCASTRSSRCRKTCSARWAPTPPSHPLVLVMTRDAVRPVPPRTDPELVDRAHVRRCPARARSRSPAARASIPAAADAAIDAALGRGTDVTARPRARRSPACLQCHAASAADGESDDGVEHAVRGRRRAVGAVRVAARRSPFSDMNLQVVADGRHSVPTAIELDVDGAVRELTLPPITDRAGRERDRHRCRCTFPAMTGRRIRVTIVSTRVQLATRESTGDTVTAPVGIAELGIPGLRAAPVPATVPDRCRSDLLTIDGKAVPVRVTGSRRPRPATCRASRSTPCDPRDPGRVPTITLGARQPRGAHLRGRPYRDAARSRRARVGRGRRAAGRCATAGSPGSATRAAPAPTVTVVHDGATRMRVHVTRRRRSVLARARRVAEPRVEGDDRATPAIARSVAARRRLRQRLDGDARRRSSFDVVLEWTPQRRVWAAIWISLVAALLCLALIGVGVRRAGARGSAISRRSPSDADVRVEWPSPPRGAPGGHARVAPDRRADPRRARGVARSSRRGPACSWPLAGRRDPVATVAPRVLVASAPAALLAARDRATSCISSTISGSRRCSSGRRCSRSAARWPGSRWCSSVSTCWSSGCERRPPDAVRQPERSAER